uniref:Uncharacterized protein n=1 Tax=Tanacetum cinerariifolium TaxID=118510 RepID=A0A6L2LK21_TANCI|nr:hypothetical protein [Tanacetum cinerariifolium]
MLVGLTFTGVEWERLCQAVMFFATKVLIISSNESGDFFVGKVIDSFVPELVKKFDSARGGEPSNAGACYEKSYIAEFSLCADTKGYLYPGRVSLSQNAWCLSRDKNTNVQLVGEMHRLKEVLEVNHAGLIVVFE